MSDLRALRARVEALAGPDRELDAAICAALTEGWTTHPKLTAGFIMKDRGDAYANAKLAVTPYIFADRIPASQVTASIDAALALVEKVLPLALEAASFGFMYLGRVGPWCQLAGPADRCDSGLRDYGFAQVDGGREAMPRAILSALLAALALKEGKQP